MRGKVKWFNEQQGYGFIKRDDGFEDVFVHFTAIEGNGFKALHEGDNVEFDLNKSPSGKKHASNVRIIKEMDGNIRRKEYVHKTNKLGF